MDKKEMQKETVRALAIGRERLKSIKQKINKDVVVQGKDNRQMESMDVDYEGGKVLEPPYDLEVLSILPELSDILPQCIDALKQNVEGFGYDLISKVPIKDDKNMETEVEKEQGIVIDFCDNVNYDYDLETLRKMMRQDLEATGNAYFEILRNNKDEISGFEYVQVTTVRITTQDKDSIEYDIKKVNKDGKVTTEKREKRFRRYVQTNDDTKVFFKEFGDPREISKATGKPVTDDDNQEAELKGEEIKLATEIYHFKIHNSRSAYGIPRWIGTFLAVLGNRASEEINYDYFDNKAVPPLALLVSGGTLSTATVQRIEDYVNENLRGRQNFHKILVVEAITKNIIGSEKLPNITFKELSQIDEAKFLEYADKNAAKVRSAFRLPPLYIGKSEDYTHATAKESRKIADPQVFQPERKVFDNFMNKRVFPELDIKLVKFVSKGEPYNKAEDWAEILEAFSKMGLTPREIRKVIDTLTEIELEDYESKAEAEAWLDVPINIAEKIAGSQQVMKMITEKAKDTGNEDMYQFAMKLLQLKEMLASGKLKSTVQDDKKSK